MNRALILVILVATVLSAMPIGASTGAGGAPAELSPDTSTDRPVLADAPPAAIQAEERPENPSTEGTIGYVEGYWYDDDLPVDEQDDAVVSEDDLDAVIYRSMARVEVIRGLTFEEAPSVDVVSRAEFQDDPDQMLDDPTELDRVLENVRHETLFLTDRNSDVFDEFVDLQGDAVGGYYVPETDEIVLVAEDTENPAVRENVLGHELLHALQDQHFDLEDGLDQGTNDELTAAQGLIEGDATLVQSEYELRCFSEWSCLPLPMEAADMPEDSNWGLYYQLMHSYLDGMTYVEGIRSQGGWEAVNDQYDDYPTSSSEVIRPGEERAPTDIDHDDRSSEEWERLDDEHPEGLGYERFGEVAIVSAFGANAEVDDEPSVLSAEEFLDSGSVFGGVMPEYDQPATDGWVGDKHVTYVPDADAIDADATDPLDPDLLDETGFVWHTEWRSEADAESFLEAYLELLEIHDAEPVTERADTFELDEDVPGAYYIEHDETSATIVRAPSVDELDEIREGAAPDGADRLSVTSTSDGATDSADDDDDADDDSVPGFVAPAALLAVLLVALIASRR